MLYIDSLTSGYQRIKYKLSFGFLLLTINSFPHLTQITSTLRINDYNASINMRIIIAIVPTLPFFILHI